MVKKVMLASDYMEAKIKYPVMAQPKIDGVRGANLDGDLTGRSLKHHANIYTTRRYSLPYFLGFDGELVVGPNPCDLDLCRKTTSAVNTVAGEPDVRWHLFDYITDETINLPYEQRLTKLHQAVADYTEKLCAQGFDRDLIPVKVVPTYLVKNLQELLELDDMWLDMGYEGTIIRDPAGLYKQGRSTVREGGLLRIKRFIEEEAIVLSVVEGNTNTNEAKINELGQTERSTHQANMIPNGMVGTLECRLVKDIVYKGTTLFKKDSIVTVGAGRMTHDERIAYFKNPDLIVGQTIKFKLFPRGIKDKPRFPTYQSIRAASDMGGE